LKKPNVGISELAFFNSGGGGYYVAYLTGDEALTLLILYGC
jgi:hypothetical protein